MIKVLYLTNSTKEEIVQRPSNTSYYIKNMFSDERINVCLPPPSRPNKHGLIRNTILLFLTINKIGPDILYLDNLLGLKKIIVLKRLGLLKCKIIVWKYTYCKQESNPLKNWFLRNFYWKGIDRIYMMFDNHTEDAITNCKLHKEQVVTLSRGVDMEWYEKYLGQPQNDFLVMATGKDSRDYKTLSEACEQAQIKCLIITRRHESNVKVAEEYHSSKYVKILFVEDLKLKDEYSYIMRQVSQASILAIPCEKRNYGVGYTNLIEALPFSIPILMTHNPDIHVDVNKEGIGYLIPPYDVETWKEKIIYLKSHPEVIKQMESRIKEMVKGEYSDKTTTAYIINDFLKLCNKK